MGYGSYCWSEGRPDGGRRGVCVEATPPPERDDVPKVRVEQGAPLTFHLGFTPDRLSLHTYPDGGTVSLPPNRTDVRWTVDREGYLRLTADRGSGDAGYVLLVETDAPTP